MSNLFVDAADFIDQAVRLDAEHPLHRLRRERGKIVEATQASQRAMFGDAVTGLTRRERLAVALRVSRLSKAEGLAALYAQALAADGAPPDGGEALGHSAEPRLRALLDFASTLTLRPVDGDRRSIEALQAAGLDPAAIVALAQLIAYLTYQVRLVAGLGAMAAAGPAPALRSEAPQALTAPQTVAALPAGAPALRINGFTTATLGWSPWVAPVEIDQATPEQLAAIDAMSGTARQSVGLLPSAGPPA